MKINNITISANGAGINLGFRDPEMDQEYVVKNIAGLDVDEITHRFYGSSQSSDKSFYEMTLQPRKVLIRLGLNPTGAGTYSSLRDEIYKKIASSRTGEVTLALKFDATTIAVISGLVSKLEATHFDKKPELQMTLLCDDPILRSPTAIVAATPTYPVDTLSITDSLSTAPHGFSFKVIAEDDGIPTLEIGQGTRFNWDWRFNVIVGSINGYAGFKEGDEIYFSSVEEDRYFYLLRSGSKIPLIDKIQPGSVWPMIFPGVNNFYVNTASASITWNDVKYYNAYWGL